MSHEPCAPVRDLEHSVKLVGAHALFAGAKQVIGQQPFAQGDMAVCEDRSDRDSERLPASLALPEAGASALALQLVGFANHSTMGADRAIRPADSLKELPRFVLIAEIFG